MKKVIIILLLTVFNFSNAYTEDEKCIAVAIYKEASGENVFGQVAVMDTIQQRMKDKHKTACQIIKEPGQFSWGTSNIKPTKQQLTRYRFVSRIPPVVEGARYFHNASVKPSWTRKMKVKAKIGRHVFY